MTDDAELLRQYAQSGSETAFAELVGRYLPLVYAAALRLVGGDEALAQDVAQTVFIDLAGKARSLRGRELLAGWLYTSARLAASKAVRGEQRRRRREQIAVSMEERTIQPESPQDQTELKQVLDEAMGELAADERNAVLLRYFQAKELKEVGVALGISEDAARMRVTRALGKLQVLLKERGVTITTVALGTALVTEASVAVPAGLAASISAAALSGTTMTSGGVIAATKTIAMTTLQKAVITVTVAAAVITATYQVHRASILTNQLQSLKQEHELSVERVRELSTLLSNATNQAVVQRSAVAGADNASELLRLRGAISGLRSENQQLAKDFEAATAMAGAIRWKPLWKDVGQKSPEATVETYLWAGLSINGERMRQLLAFDHRTNDYAVSQIYAEREARAEGEPAKFDAAGGVRLVKVKQDGNSDLDRATVILQAMRPSIEGGHVVEIDPSNPPEWEPNYNRSFGLVRLDGEWRIVADEGKVRLTIDDPDSQAVANMLIRMSADQVQGLRSMIPAETLRIYEELRAKGITSEPPTVPSSGIPAGQKFTPR